MWIHYGKLSTSMLRTPEGADMIRARALSEDLWPAVQLLITTLVKAGILPPLLLLRNPLSTRQWPVL